MFTIVTFRDPFGIIPLYIGYSGDGTTWFCSELKGLQKSCDHIEVIPRKQPSSTIRYSD